MNCKLIKLPIHTTQVLSLLMLWTLWIPRLLATDRSNCFSCRIEIDNLDSAKDLEGDWLFTRDDRSSNAFAESSTDDWVTVSAPGPWTKAYNDTEKYRVGWYRGNFIFKDAMQGKELVFYVDAYMSKMTIFIDGQMVFDRKGKNSLDKYYSIQPVPVRFFVTKPVHVIAIRIDTPLMTGIYQSPFQLRSYQKFDNFINFFQIFCGELRYLFAYIFAWMGAFFLVLYFRTKYPLYMIAGMTGIGVFPFYAMPNEVSLKFFDPDTLLILHYPGIAFMALGYFLFSQFFHKYTPRIAKFYATVIILYGLIFMYLAFDFHLGLFQVVRKSLFIVAFAIATHGVFNCIMGYKKDKRVGPAVVGEIIFWLCSGHDILLALGLIHSTSLIFIGTFAGIFAIMLITTRLFAETFVDNKVLLKKVEFINEGLEKTVLERTSNLREKTQEITSILDSLPEGIVEADSDLKVLSNYSQALKTILGQRNITGRDLFELVFSESNVSEDALAQARSVLEMSIGESRFTFEANCSALPGEITRKVGQENKVLLLGWSVICNDEDCVSKILITLIDITRQKVLEKESALLKLRAKIIESVINVSQSRLIVSIREAHKNISAIWSLPVLEQVDTRQVYRELHTLKGNSRTFEMNDMSNLCHLAETELEAFKHKPEVKTFESLNVAMHQVLTALANLIGLIDRISVNVEGVRTTHNVEVHPSVLHQLDLCLHDLDRDSPILGLVRSLRYQSARLIAVGFRQQFRSLALSLGKLEANFDINISPRLLLDPEFSNRVQDMLGHLIRNSLDHGIETQIDRLSHGKPKEGTISIDLYFEADAVVLRYRDDGSGLDLKRILEKACQQGLCKPSEESTELVAACIFQSGFSTAKSLNEVSGRGVGMDAVLAEITRWKGTKQWLGHKASLRHNPRPPFDLEMRFPGRLGYELSYQLDGVA